MASSTEAHAMLGIDEHGAIAMGSLPGQGPVTVPYGRYLVGVRVACGDTYFFKGRFMTIGTIPISTVWFSP